MTKTILLVDDETFVVDIARRKLQEKGYDVMTAYDGEEALVRLNERVPDLIVVDIQMPKMNGYTFLMEKDKVPAFQNIPVITVTSYNEMEPLFKRHGVKAYLLKPLKLQAFLDKIVEVAGPPS
jgi:CheY-like chemotaxis protein